MRRSTAVLPQRELASVGARARDEGRLAIRSVIAMTELSRALCAARPQFRERVYVMPIATAAATAIASAPPITATGIQRGIGSDGASPMPGISAACAAGPIA